MRFGQNGRESFLHFLFSMKSKENPAISPDFRGFRRRHTWHTQLDASDSFMANCLAISLLIYTAGGMFGSASAMLQKKVHEDSGVEHGRMPDSICIAEIAVEGDKYCM